MVEAKIEILVKKNIKNNYFICLKEVIIFFYRN